MTLWDKYLEYHPEILSRLGLIDEKSKGKFTKKLKKEKDRDNFVSTLTELQFYELFSTNGFNVEFEKEYNLKTGTNKYTPDLTITKNEQSIIAEVVKLNPTEKDKRRNDFGDYLFEEIEKIEVRCLLEMEFIDQYFDVTAYNKEEIVEKVREWLPKNCYLNSMLILHSNFKFKVINIDDKYEHTGVMSGYSSIDIDTRRLSSSRSQFVQKTEKYDVLVNTLSLPYIICIKIDFLAGINENEMFWTMYGDSLYYEHLNKNETALNGIFYDNEMAKRNLSGVVLMVGNNFFYYNNYSYLNKLNAKTKNELLKNQYFGKTFNRFVYLREIQRKK